MYLLILAWRNLFYMFPNVVFFAYFYEELLKNYYILIDGNNKNKLYRKKDMLSAFAHLFSLLLIEKHYLFNKNKNNTCS